MTNSCCCIMWTSYRVGVIFYRDCFLKVVCFVMKFELRKDDLIAIIQLLFMIYYILLYNFVTFYSYKLDTWLYLSTVFCYHNLNPNSMDWSKPSCWHMLATINYSNNQKKNKKTGEPVDVSSCAIFFRIFITKYTRFHCNTIFLFWKKMLLKNINKQNKKIRLR